MGKNIMISDNAYAALRKLKRGSFSDTILWLIEQREKTADKLVKLFEQQAQLLERQNDLLNQLVEQLRRLNARLVELKASKKTVEFTVKQVEENIEHKEDSKMPSFLQDNPWVEILQRRET